MRALLCISLWLGGLSAEARLFDMDAMRDVRSLDVKVLKDWHAVRGEVVTRQKLISIRVGELVPGHEYRLPVRFIVPHDAKAKGFHLTGGHNFQNIQNDFRPPVWMRI